MRSNASGQLNPIKMNHNNSLILSPAEYTGTFNKNNEKIRKLQYDLETTKDTIIKLKAELINKNKEINELKYFKNDKNEEYKNTLKKIEIVLKLTDNDLSSNNDNKDEKLKNSNVNNIETENKNEIKEENNNPSSVKLPPISTHSEQNSKKLNKTNKEQPYIVSLKMQINSLKELITKKDDEIKENQNNKTLDYSKLQNNLEKNYSELTNIRKQNELMKTKIEDVTNLLFMEKEGNKSLKSKLLVYQSSFKEFQDNSEKKNSELESKLFQAQERQRDCRIFHIRRSSAPEQMGTMRSSRANHNNEIDDNERLKYAEEEIKNIKKEIDSMNKDINNKNKENEQLKNNKNELEKKMNQLKENNNKLKNEINNLNKNVKELNNKKSKLEKENKEIKNKYNTSNNNLKNEQNKTTKIKDNLNKKENEILELKKEIEKLKQNNNFKDGMFFTSIGAKGKTKNNNVEDLDVNIDEELAQIEKKYKMINEQNKLNKEEVKSTNKIEKNE